MKFNEKVGKILEVREVTLSSLGFVNNSEGIAILGSVNSSHISVEQTDKGFDVQVWNGRSMSEREVFRKKKHVIAYVKKQIMDNPTTFDLTRTAPGRWRQQKAEFRKTV